MKRIGMMCVFAGDLQGLVGALTALWTKMPELFL
jgi:hypothetical protein